MREAVEHHDVRLLRDGQFDRSSADGRKRTRRHDRRLSGVPFSHLHLTCPAPFSQRKSPVNVLPDLLHVARASRVMPCFAVSALATSAGSLESAAFATSLCAWHPTSHEPSTQVPLSQPAASQAKASKNTRAATMRALADVLTSHATDFDMCTLLHRGAAGFYSAPQLTVTLAMALW
jgi:hypothetical protein